MLQSISLHNFRCLEGADWSPGPGRHVLVGANGTGKTSVLEAIYFLATTRSFRTSRIEDCLNWKADEFWIRGRLAGSRGFELLASWQRGGASRRINGKNAALSEYLGQLAALSWSARDDRFIDGEPAVRRRLLDQGIVARRPGEVETLATFRRILAAKRGLLAVSGASADESLGSWNELMAQTGHRLAQLRASYVVDLDRAFRDTLLESAIELPSIRFEYQPDPESGLESIEAFHESLQSVRSRELERKRVLTGPHRDRLRITWGEADIGRTASAGERKLFGLILTAARRKVLRDAGREPIVLLDDLDAALDADHLKSAWTLFESAPQVFITSADSGTGRGISGLSTWLLNDAGIAAL